MKVSGKIRPIDPTRSTPRLSVADATSNMMLLDADLYGFVEIIEWIKEALASYPGKEHGVRPLIVVLGQGVPRKQQEEVAALGADYREKSDDYAGPNSLKQIDEAPEPPAQASN